MHMSPAGRAARSSSKRSPFGGADVICRRHHRQLRVKRKSFALRKYAGMMQFDQQGARFVRAVHR
eukprot:902191-Pyramimonas_sp.AAC.1